MTYLRIWIFNISVFALLNCSTPPLTEEEHKERLRAQIEEEVHVGKMMAERLAGHFGAFFKNPRLVRYVNLVGQTILRHSARPEITYYFAILDTEEINAFATPGGYVFVTRGLLTKIRSEDELAGVLAHEIAHINEKHMYSQIKKDREVSSSETLVRMMSRGGSQMGEAVATMVNKGLDILVEDGLGKEKEFEADWAGSVYVSAVGYDPWALKSYLERIKTQLSTVKVAKTHPPFEERIAAFEKFLKQNGLKAVDNRHLLHRFSLNMSQRERTSL